MASEVPVHLWPLIFYVGIYVLAYLGPFFWNLISSRFSDELTRLAGDVRDEAAKEKERRAERAPVEAHTNTADTYAPDSETAAAPSPSDESSAPEHAQALRADYDNTLVAEAAAQLDARYPGGDYRRFEAERLPAYAAYTERLTAARNMAGLFVLCGLLGTMMKLEDVVAEIGGAASVSSMEAEQFLDSMGTIMTDTSGAFLSSIYGLGAMIVALLVVGLLDRTLMQRKFDRLDRVVQDRVIPTLVELQALRAPNLSMADRIRETSTQLDRLNDTVVRLTEGMANTLSDLGDRIETMLDEFGSFHDQYTRLNDIIETLRDSTKSMEKTAQSLESMEETAQSLREAAGRIKNPIDQLNSDLNSTIKDDLGSKIEEQTKAVKASVEATRQNRQDVIGKFTKLQREVTRVAGKLERMVDEHLEQNEAHREQVRRMAEALEAANTQELAGKIEQLHQELGKASKQLDQSTDRLDESLDQLDRSTHSLDRAAQHLGDRGSETLFGWVRRGVQGNGER